MRSKRCFKCGETKSIRDFYKHPRMADGHLNKCKECAKCDAKNVDPEKRREYERARMVTPARKWAVSEYRKAARARDPERFARYHREYHERYPERRKARVIVGNAIKAGTLKRGPCSVCGKKRAQAHHEDYSKPLNVRWLCSGCHGKEHRRCEGA